MKIKALRTLISPSAGHMEPGRDYEVSEATGKALIEAGVAEQYETKVVEEKPKARKPRAKKKG